MRRTKRVKKGVKTRKMRGGSGTPPRPNFFTPARRPIIRTVPPSPVAPEYPSPTYLPPGDMPNWPSINGCDILQVENFPIVPSTDKDRPTLLDRIGQLTGSFVAVMGEDRAGRYRPAAFDERAMRILGETKYDHMINGRTVDLRELEYAKIYNKNNDKYNQLYYVLEVVKPFIAKGPCIAKGNVFGYKGGVLQLGLSEPVEELIKKGVLKKLTTQQMIERGLPLFPPYTDPTFRPDPRTGFVYEEFVPHDKQFVPIVNEFRRNKGLPLLPLPPGSKPLAPELKITTVEPKTVRGIKMAANFSPVPARGRLPGLSAIAPVGHRRPSFSPIRRVPYRAPQ